MTLEDLDLGILQNWSARVCLNKMVDSFVDEDIRKNCAMVAHKHHVDAWNQRLKNKRFKKAYDMRQEGCVYRVIGKALNVTAPRAYQIVERYKQAQRGVIKYRLTVYLD